MKNIYEKVKKYVLENRMISSGDKIIAGVSGGADSVCMLLILRELSKELNFRILVVHVHHGVRADADADAVYVEKLCSRLEIPYLLKKVDMITYAKENGLSLEEAGRMLRYQIFEEVCLEERETSKIAVAHNQNDRAETMLFHLFRGSGLRGLGSIRPVRGQIIRPLLCLKRAEIEDYLAKRNITFCIDSTNDEDTYTRNRIRHHILTYAETKICENATAHMGDAADILAETQDYVQKQTDIAYTKCLISSSQEHSILDLCILQKEDFFIQKMVLLYCMEQMTPFRKDITKEHVNALMRIIEKDGSKEISLPYGIAAYKEYDKLILSKKREHITSYPPLSVSVPGEVVVPELGVLEFHYLEKEEFFSKNKQIIPEKTYTKWFDYDKITTVLLLRTRKAGDYLTIDSDLHKKSLKEYMVNEKIPKMQRERIYMLADGAHILWVPGYRISQYYKVDENTKRILQVQLRGGGNG